MNYRKDATQQNEEKSDKIPQTLAGALNSGDK